MNRRSIDEIKKAQKKAKQQEMMGRLLGGFSAAMEKNPVSFALTLSLLLGILVTALVGLGAWQTFVVQERNHQLEKFAEQNARVASSHVSRFMRDAHVKLEFFTKSSSLATSLVYKDPVGLLEIKNAIRNSFPHAEAIRLFAVGDAKLDLEAKPPMRFAELEQIRRAEAREVVKPEALDSGDSGWRVNVVVPVPDDERKPVVGTIMVVLPIETLYEQLRTGLDGMGRVALYQEFDGKQRLLGTFGQGELYKAQRIEVPNTPWQVEFTASKALRAKTEVDYVDLGMVGFVGGFGIIVVFLLGGLVVGRLIQKKYQAVEETHRRMGRSPREESDAPQVEIELNEDNEALLGSIDEASETGEDPLDISEAFGEELEVDVPAHIFRRYDVRGLYESEITHELAQKIGQALGSEAMESGERSLIVGRDARTHSPILTENLIRGILSTGCDVINIGTVPTPVLYYAVETLEQTSSAVMVTASHNPGEYNGFKVVMKGKTRSEDDIQAIRERILRKQFKQGIGSESSEDVVDRYIDTIFSDVALAAEMTIVIDAGNGVTGKVAPKLFSELGCTVIPLFCDLDGTFPNHGPDPSVAENLQALIKKVQEANADLGVAFDGDGDRLAVVTPKGHIIWPDQLLMLFAKDILARNPGADVVFDVKSSRLLNATVSSNGGRPIMWKTGHALMRAKVEETGALLGGEYSGHIFIKDRWFGFDDGMYAAARLIEIVSLVDESLDDVFDALPKMHATQEIRVDVAEAQKFELIERLKSEGDFGDAKLITIDGVRAEFAYGWGLVRASNTAAHLTLRFEAESEEQIHSLKAMFTREIRKLDNSIQFHWS